MAEATQEAKSRPCWEDWKLLCGPMVGVVDQRKHEDYDIHSTIIYRQLNMNAMIVQNIYMYL